DNLLFGLRHRPLTPRERKGEELRRYERERAEALLSGNSGADPDADWTDYAAAGVNSSEELRDATISALRIAAFDEDVYQIGMRGTVDPERRPDVAERILEARRAFRSRLRDGALADLVESWDPKRYNSNATV